MPVEEKVNWTPIVIGASALGMMGLGIYYWTREPEGIRDAKITGYRNLTTGQSASAGKVLNISKGDVLEIDFQYIYKGPALTGQYHYAIWKPTTFDKHDEFDNETKPFTIPGADKSTTVKESVQLLIDGVTTTDDIYGVYVKILSIPGADIHLNIAEVIVVGKAPLPGIDFQIIRPTTTPSGTVAPGTSITIVCSVRSLCDANQIIAVQCNIHEGSGIWPTPGTLIASYNSAPFTISPNQTAQLSYNHVTVKGTIDHRDIVVKVLKAGVVVKESENFNDVYKVSDGIPPPLKPPNVITGGASELATDGAILYGQLYGIGSASAVDVYFEYGETTAYGKSTSKVRKYPADDYKIFEAEVYGLLNPNTTYHFRAVADPVDVGIATGYGKDETFTTLPLALTKVYFGVLWTGLFTNPNSKWRVTIPNLNWDSGKKYRYQTVKYQGELPSYTVTVTFWVYNPQGMLEDTDNFDVRLHDNDFYQWDMVKHTIQ